MKEYQDFARLTGIRWPVYMRSRGMDQAEAERPIIQSRPNYMRPNSTTPCAGLGYGRGTSWSNYLAPTINNCSIGNGFSRVALVKVSSGGAKNAKMFAASLYVCPRCGADARCVGVARCIWQCPTVPGRAHEHHDSLTCPRNLTS